MAAAEALVAEPEFLHDPSARMILRPDVGLDPVQANGEEAMIDSHRERGRGDAPASADLVNPVTDLPTPSRTPLDAAHGELAREPPAVGYGPGHRDALARLAPHRAGHRDIRPEARTIQGGLRIRWLPRPQPGAVAQPGLAPGGGVTDADRAQRNRHVEQLRLDGRAGAPRAGRAAVPRGRGGWW